MTTPMLRGHRVWLRMIEKADMLATDIDDRDLGHYAGFKFSFSDDMVDGWFRELTEEMGSGTTYQFTICPLGLARGHRRHRAARRRHRQRQRLGQHLPDRCQPLGHRAWAPTQ